MCFFSISLIGVSGMEICVPTRKSSLTGRVVFLLYYRSTFRRQHNNASTVLDIRSHGHHRVLKLVSIFDNIQRKALSHFSASVLNEKLRLEMCDVSCSQLYK